MKKIKLTLLFIAVSLISWNQDGFVVEEEGSREVHKSTKINTIPKIKDTIIAIPNKKYSLLNIQQNINHETSKINASKIKLIDQLDKIYNSFVKLGIGYPIMPLAEIYVNSQRNRKYNWGFHAKHLSNWTKIKGYMPSFYDNNSLDAFGKIIQKKYQLSGNINFFNNGNRFYGLKSENIPKDTLKQRFNNVGVGIQFNSRGKDSAVFHYTVSTKYTHFMDLKNKLDSTNKRFARENLFEANSHFKYRIKNHLFAGDFNINYNGYKYGEHDTLLSNGFLGRKRNNFIINLAPEFSSFGKKWLVRVGAGLVFDLDNHTKFHIFPKLHFQYSLFNDIFIPYLGIRGGLNQHTFKSLTRQNQFLFSSLSIQNEAQQFDAYIGFKGSITKKITFNTSISFGRYRDIPLFINDSSQTNRFNVIYDTMYKLNIEAVFSYQANEKIKIDFIGNYFFYKTFTEIFVWNKPDYQFFIRGSYNLIKKFIFNLDVTLQGGRKAKLHKAEENSLIKENVNYKKLGFLADVNLGFEYRYTNRFSAFIQLNNLAAQNYLRFNNYPVQSFQIMVGLTFKF